MAHKNEILELVEQAKIVLGQKFRFGSVATLDEVTAFEARFDIRLPEDFRWFVLQIANGITCNDSLLPDSLLGRIDFENYFCLQNEYNPSIPFGLTSRTFFSEIDCREDYPFESFFDADGSILEDGYRNGEIRLASYGCGTEAFLVVNGPEYAHVWIDNFSSGAEVFPCFHGSEQRLNFLDWIALALTKSIERHQQSIDSERSRQEHERAADHREQQTRQIVEENRLRLAQSARQSTPGLFQRLLRFFLR